MVGGMKLTQLNTSSAAMLENREAVAAAEIGASPPNTTRRLSLPE